MRFDEPATEGPAPILRESDWRDATRRRFLAGSVGALGAAILPAPPRPLPIPEGPPPRPPDVWVADRGSGRVWALGADLVPLGSLPAHCPVEIEGVAEVRGARAGPPGLEAGAWVLEATGRGPQGARDLVRVGLSGVVIQRLHLAAARLLGVRDGGRAVVLHRPRAGGELLQHFSTHAAPVTVAVPGAHCASLGAGHVLVGGPRGRLRLLRAGPVRWDLVAVGAVEGFVHDVAVESGAGGWALTGTPGRIVRLDCDLGVSAVRASAPGARSLFPLGRGRVPWTVDGRGSAVQGGSAGRWPAPGGGLEVLRPDGRGGGLAACLGAVLRLDMERGWIRAQGGFDEVVDARASVARASEE